MRELKFRVWNGDYFEFSNFNFKTGCLGCNFSAYVELDTPQQFTGLKDKSGVEIYEGDIVIVNESHKLLKADFGENKRVVQWRTGGACLDMLHADYLESKRKVGLTFDNGSVDSIKVVGNIYENPELLKAAN